MSAQLIDGKAISQQIKDELKDKCALLKEKGIDVTLAVILVGEDPLSLPPPRLAAAAALPAAACHLDVPGSLHEVNVQLLLPSR